jgi:hypothetical protein
MKSLAILPALGLAAVFACSSSQPTSEDEPEPIPATNLTGAPTSTTPGPSAPSTPVKPTRTARDFFDKEVIPNLSVCGSCHNLGISNTGAPGFYSNADRGLAYRTMEARGYIDPQTQLKRRGEHAGPRLTDQQRKVITDWIDLEGAERGGKFPSALLSTLGKCLDKATFDAIQLDALRTQRRQGENANQCTGCDNGPCQMCHQQGEAGFLVNSGNLSAKSFEALKDNQRSAEGAILLQKFITISGGELAPSTALADKGKAAAAGPDYSHPKYVIAPQIQTAIDNFAKASIAKYKANNNSCP